MALLPRVNTFFVGNSETSYTINTSLDTTEERGTWPFTLVPGLAVDAGASVFKTTSTVSSFAPWPFAPLAFNQGQIDKAVAHVSLTEPETQADEYVFDNGLRGETLTMDVLANDSDNNVLNNVSPLLGPELIVRSIDDSGFTLGTLAISEDKTSVEFVLGENSEFYFGDAFLGAETLTQTFTYTVTDLTGISSTETVTVTISQLVREVEDGDGSFGEYYGTDDHETILGSSEHDFIRGEGGNDTIYGGEGEDEINAGAGNDVVYGDDDDDYIIAWSGNDTVYGGEGDDEIRGDSGDDRLFGGDEGPAGGGTIDYGRDTILGGSGDDYIDGGNGDDRLSGGSGDDTIYGGEGADTFFFFGGYDVDAVMDFNDANGDQIRFTDGFAGLVGLLFESDFIALAESAGSHLGSLDDGDSFAGISVYDDVREIGGTEYSGLTISNGDDALFLNGVTNLYFSDVDYSI